MASRFARACQYWRALPHHLVKTYPEQTFFYVTFALPSTVYGIYRVKTEFDWDGVPPWYRDRYVVVRPEDPLALAQRPPSDYPAPYLIDDGR